jgi:alkylated DNA repair dioxygenase AlkB
MQLQIIQNNYLHVPDFISESEARALANEFRDHCKKFELAGDAQAPDSHALYDFLPFVKLLVKKVSHVSELLEEDVLPTYTYARVYKKGSVLDRHRDRPACEISFTLNLGKDVDWPIYFQRPDGSETSIELNPGDAVLYLGCQADHWRNVFEGEEHIQVFLHYVRSSGPKAWAFFDKKQQQEPTLPITELPITIL